MLKKLIVALVVTVVVAAIFVSWLMMRAGQFKDLEPLALPRCRAVAGAPGAEDFALDREHGLVFVSSFDRRAAQAGTPRPGAIYLYDLTAGDAAAPRDLTAGSPVALYPHGISLWSGPEGTFLHVVNHPPDGHTIEIFEWHDGALTHLETLRSELLVSPNDVAAAGPRQCYVSNDHRHTRGAARLLEDYLQRAEANVVRFDGGRWSEAASGIAYANGVALSADGDELYVASTTGGRVHVFARDRRSGALEPTDVIDLGTGVDNIEVDRHGMLWIGAHPKLLSFVAHAGDPGKLSPSQVLWVDPQQALDPPVAIVMLSLGEDLSGSSVAVPWGSRLLVGSVFEPHFLDCERAPGVPAAAGETGRQEAAVGLP